MRNVNLDSCHSYDVYEKDNKFFLRKIYGGGIRRNISDTHTEISEDEYKALISEAEEFERKRNEEKKEKESEHDKKMSWFKKIEGVYPEMEMEIKNGEVFDNYGNFLFYAPKKPVDISTWLEEKIEDFMENCE